MKVQQRDIFLVPFPFSDFSGKKIRPVLVISKDKFNESSEDVIVCSLTSNIVKEFYSVYVENKDLEEGKLFDPCCVKVENILKMDKKLLIKNIGKLKEGSFSGVLRKLNSLFV